MSKTSPIVPVDKHRRQFSVIRRVPQLDGDPTFVVVCTGSGTTADAAGQFWNEVDAKDYAEWRNTTPIIQRKPKL